MEHVLGEFRSTGLVVNCRKNRDREPPTFANINLLGRCNVNCFFCLGKDIAKELNPHNQLAVHFSEWNNFHDFLQICKENYIKKLYLTGQTTDPLLYTYFSKLIDFLHHEGFLVGIRTNGYAALSTKAGKRLTVGINNCDLSVGYSIHSLSPITSKMILGRKEIPDWDTILSQTRSPRVSIVLNRCNQHEFFQILHYLKNFSNIKYTQVRRVSTDTRQELLLPDMVAYEQVYTMVRNTFPRVKKLWGDADAFDIFGMEVVFWRTVKTTVNSFNYFTDGTISKEYFVVEGYLKNRGKERWKIVN